MTLLDADDHVVAAEHLGGQGDLEPSLRAFSDRFGEVDAVGVRVVDGGSQFREPVLVSTRILSELDPLVALAPLHNPWSFGALRAMYQAQPERPVVACFDTTFHRTLPQEARTYALPKAWRQRWGLERLGFHGLSHGGAARRAGELMGRAHDPGLRIVSCHLGAGASLAAIRGGCSVDTTMGFTPMDGLVMATRSGSVDPGVILWMLQHGGIGIDEMQSALNSESGLRGLTGSADLREVLQRAAGGEEACVLARDVYLHRLVACAAQMVASLGGVDGLVFTGGVGEGSDEVRQRCCQRLVFLGATVDEKANREHVGGDTIISTPGSAVTVMVVAAREDREIAREVRALVAQATTRH